MQRTLMILATLVLMSHAMPRFARSDEPRLVPHLVAIQHNQFYPEWSDAFLRLEDEDAVALIRKPTVPGAEFISIGFDIQGYTDPLYALLDPYLSEAAILERIELTLQQNLGDRLSAEERVDLAALIYRAMHQEEFWVHAPEVQIVERGGMTTLGLVFWHRGWSEPTSTMVAKAGPAGDILVLGRFWVENIAPESQHEDVRQTISVTGNGQPYLLAIVWGRE